MFTKYLNANIKFYDSFFFIGFACAVVEGSLQEQSEGLSIDGPDGTREKTIKDSSNKAKKRKPVTSSSATMTPSTFHRPIVLLTSGLDDEDSQQLVAKFVHTFPHAAVTMAIEPTASIPVLGSSAQPTEAKAEDINADVESVATHLVVSVDRHNVFPHRTIKYLQALIGTYSTCYIILSP